MNTKVYISIALLSIPLFTFSMENTKLQPHIIAFNEAVAFNEHVTREIIAFKQANKNQSLPRELFVLRIETVSRVEDAKRALENAQKS